MAAMKPFTMSEYSAEWLKAFNAMFPSGAHSPAKERTPKEALIIARQEWEGEGGNLKPEKE